MNRAMQYLAPSETLHLETGPHPVVMNGSLAVAVAIVACASGLGYFGLRAAKTYAIYDYGVAVLLLFAAASVVIQALLRRASQLILVTDHRIIEIRGLWTHNLRELRLEAVQGVSLDQSIYGRLFNFGTVTLQTGNDNPMVLEDIAFPLELLQALQDDRTHRLEAAAGIRA